MGHSISIQRKLKRDLFRIAWNLVYMYGITSVLGLYILSLLSLRSSILETAWLLYCNFLTINIQGYECTVVGTCTGVIYLDLSCFILPCLLCPYHTLFIPHLLICVITVFLCYHYYAFSHSWFFWTILDCSHQPHGIRTLINSCPFHLLSAVVPVCCNYLLLLWCLPLSK